MLAGAIHAGKKSAAGAPEEAQARVLPLLAAIAESPGAAVACLARACTQLKAKSRLPAGKIAAGLQDVITAHGGLSRVSDDPRHEKGTLELVS